MWLKFTDNCEKVAKKIQQISFSILFKIYH